MTTSAGPQPVTPPKNLILIVSAGRTATMFFGDLLSRMIEGAYSVHEPDTLTLSWRDLLGKIRTFGFHHMVIGRLRGETGIRSISNRLLTGRMSLEDAARCLARQRDAYYVSLPGNTVIEANYQWFGVLPAVPLAFRRYKVACIVRDPRSWLTSIMNTGRHFGSRDLVSKLGFERVNALMVGDGEFSGRWPVMGPFERNCWRWRYINSRLTEFVASVDRAEIFRYEDLFRGDEDTKEFIRFLEFLTDFEDEKLEWRFEKSLLSRRRNKTRRALLSDWPDWTPAHVRAVDRICGELMRRFGYGVEDAWLARLSQLS